MFETYYILFFWKNVQVIKVEVSAKITKYVDFIVACIEFPKAGVYHF